MSSKRHEQLTAAGWIRQITYDEPRLSEIAQTYRELGFEVRLEHIDPDDQAGCSECLDPERFRTIYTRPCS